MSCRICVLLVLLVAQSAVQMPAASAHDDAPDISLAYTPTGDALWDTYAQALLDSLPQALIDYDGITFYETALPDELLAEWEPRFADDPRYWQLRYWNAEQLYDSYSLQKGVVEDYSGPEPYTFLEHAEASGVMDWTIAWLLYKKQSHDLRKLWERFESGETTAEDEVALPHFDSIPPLMWYDKQQLNLLDDLVSAYPEESFFWYIHAIERFQLGEWIGGLGDLRAANTAPNNRAPLCFPFSYVVSRLALEQETGSEVAAGMVVAGSFQFGSVSLPYFIPLKDQAKNQIVRLNMGAPLAELEPWLGFLCRYGSMESSGALPWLVAVVIEGVFLKYLLVEAPESLSIEQRESLWRLHFRFQGIKDFVKHDLLSLQQDYLEIGMIEGTELEIHESQQQYFRGCYHHAQAEYGTVYRLVKNRINELEEFDFATFTWPR
ncbi:hypothetical protein IIA79_07535 [bacterium]|nr:hypothetical protein [bacterium]